MEQNVINKLDEAKELLTKRIDDYNNKVEKFLKEFFTPEMMEIIRSVIQSTSHIISIKLNNKWDIWVDKTKVEFIDKNNPNDHKHLACSKFATTNVTKVQIDYLQNITADLQLKEFLFKMFVDNADDIITEITNRYKEINESCMDKLNWIMETLGEPQDDTKHIKVTIEWI